MIEENNSSNIDLFENVCEEVCEQILGYLPFKDKIKLEGVSKQWQRCAYRQQTVLIVNKEDVINEDKNTLNELLKPIEIYSYWTGLAHSSGYKEIKKNEFEFVLKRCAQIRTVQLNCYIDDKDLLAIGKYLESLESIEFILIGITKSRLLEFGRNYGHKLKTLRLFESEYNAVLINKFLIHCPNIREIFIDGQKEYIRKDITFLPNLEIVNDFELINSDSNQEDIDIFQICTEKYGKTLKKLVVNANQFVFKAFTGIQLLVNLENLHLTLSTFRQNDDNQHNIENIDPFIQSLSEKCCKLKYFTFILTVNANWHPLNSFQSFSKFVSIRSLEIQIHNTRQLIKCKCEYFKSCTNLKHLSVSYDKISDDFFKDIGQHIPNIRSIDITTSKLLTDQSLISLSALKNLKKVYLRQNQSANENITDIGVCQLIESCTNIEDIWITSRPKITNETIDKLIAIATQRNRKLIEFRCDLSEYRDELQFDPQIDINRLNNLPQNLKINILMQ